MKRDEVGKSKNKEQKLVASIPNSDIFTFEATISADTEQPLLDMFKTQFFISAHLQLGELHGLDRAIGSPGLLWLVSCPPFARLPSFLGVPCSVNPTASFFGCIFYLFSRIMGDTTGALLLVCFLTFCTAKAAPTPTTMVGLEYINFTNYHGTVASGACCDHPTKFAPHCPPDECDTSFKPCATYVGDVQCAAYFASSSPTMFDTNSFLINGTLGNVAPNMSTSFAVVSHPYKPGDIHFNIVAREESPGSKTLIANFSFVIDWMETSYSDPPHKRFLLLKDTHAELGVEVFHQCKKTYFGPTCSTQCISKGQNRYSCLSDGSKNCTDGWKGPDCNDLVPYCTSSVCQNGGTCVNIHLGYICTCRQGYTGSACETDLTLPSTTTTFAASSLLPTTTTLATVAKTTETETSAKTTTVETAASSSLSATTLKPTVTTSKAGTTTTTTAARTALASSMLTTSSKSTATTTVKTAKPATTIWTALKTASGNRTAAPDISESGLVANRSSNGSTTPSSSLKTAASPDSQNTTMAVVTSVPVTLFLLGIVTSGAVCLYKGMKGSVRRTRVVPKPEPAMEPRDEELKEKPNSSRSPNTWDVETPYQATNALVTSTKTTAAAIAF
ncbi:hypothetical protein RRG08_022883 [Elysia crispata]|uniref:Delta-like protein n=1 Tax=Elysia crispata TaxID=231223 RepID=A0AAE0Z1X0_9GAST|nr:hypothetical protein RRG08_022883 [Elysia crispata]